LLGFPAGRYDPALTGARFRCRWLVVALGVCAGLGVARVPAALGAGTCGADGDIQSYCATWTLTGFERYTDLKVENNGLGPVIMGVYFKPGSPVASVTNIGGADCTVDGGGVRCTNLDLETGYAMSVELETVHNLSEGATGTLTLYDAGGSAQPTVRVTLLGQGGTSTVPALPPPKASSLAAFTRAVNDAVAQEQTALADVTSIEHLVNVPTLPNLANAGKKAKSAAAALEASEATLKKLVSEWNTMAPGTSAETDAKAVGSDLSLAAEDDASALERVGNGLETGSAGHENLSDVATLVREALSYKDEVLTIARSL